MTLRIAILAACAGMALIGFARIDHASAAEPQKTTESKSSTNDHASAGKLTSSEADKGNTGSGAQSIADQSDNDKSKQVKH